MMMHLHTIDLTATIRMVCHMDATHDLGWIVVDGVPLWWPWGHGTAVDAWLLADDLEQCRGQGYVRATIWRDCGGDIVVFGS